MDTGCNVRTIIDVSTFVLPPSKYSIVYINDNTTTYDFVIWSLVTFFQKTPEAAMRHAVEVDKQGESTVKRGVSHELAETLVDKVEAAAKAQGFPLKVEMREED